MMERRRRLERRAERRYALGGRIFWRKPGSKLDVRGWLSDTSLSGVSFVTGTGRRPTLNEDIELTAPDRSTLRCRVARIAPYDSRLSLVACKATAEHGPQ